MSSVAKTTLDPDVSLLVDGQPADAGDVLAAIDDLEAYVRQGYSSVSASDTHAKHLDDAIAVGTGLQKDVTSPAGDEALQITLGAALAALNALLPVSGKIRAAAMDSEGAPSGYVPTANGSGGVSYAAPGGGGAQPVDVNGTAGGALAERDMVYLDESEGEWKRIDTDSASLALGRLTGCVNEPGGISESAQGSIRILGEVSGFSGLTAWRPVYASTSAGGYTQTRPDPAAGGAQVAIKEMGYAVSSSIVLVNPRPALYMKRAVVADSASLTVAHHADPQGHRRDVRAYTSSSGAGATLTEYGEANQDATEGIQDQTPASYTADQCTGGTASASSTTAPNSASNAFDDSDATWWASNGTAGTQWLEYEFASSKTIKGYTVAAESSAFNGLIRDWVLEYYDGATWQAADTRSGQTGWTASEVRTFDVSGDHSSTRWRIRPTANNGGSNHIIGEMEMFELNPAVDGAQRLAQGFQIASSGDIQTVELYLQKTGSPAGNLTVEIYSDNGGDPDTLLATSGVVAASSVSSSLGWVTFTLASPLSLTGGTQYHAVLRTTDSASQTNYISWGSDESTPGYANGAGQSYDGASWATLSNDFIFRVIAPGTSFNEPARVGRSSGTGNDFGARYDDGAGANPQTNTTIINQAGVSLDVTLVVELE